MVQVAQEALAAARIEAVAVAGHQATEEAVRLNVEDSVDLSCKA